ncbi:MAG: cation:proton antiporter [Thermomicrobiales bacterium]
MTEVFAFAVVLLVAVLVSGLANRTILSTAVLFLVAGYILSGDVLGVVSVTSEDPVLEQFVELALFAVLFTDGMLIGFRDLRTSWRLPGRALLLGMPLTFGLLAVFAYFLFDLTWAEALLIGAVLSPTDPVFASAIVGRQEVPLRLRRMLNVESGVNDGLALPVVIILLDVIGGENLNFGALLFEVILGIAIGILIPLVALRLERSQLFSAELVYEPINTFAIGLLVFSVASLTHGNPFLAAFAAGITVSTIAPRFRDAFHHFGELIAELLKLAALFLFGALITFEFVTDIGWIGIFFAVLMLLVARPLVILAVLVRSELNMREKFAAMWFGPKGFASVAYGLLILGTPVQNFDFVLNDREFIFHVIAIAIVISILAHSSTDVVVADWFVQDDPPMSEREYEAAASAPEDP